MKTQTKLLFISFFGYLILGIGLHELNNSGTLTLNMTFNLVLSLVAFLLSQYIFHQKDKKINILVMIALAVWLLFLPNNFYMITDLIHVNSSKFYYYQSGTRVYHANLLSWFTLFHLAGGVILAALLGATSISKVQQYVKVKTDAVLSHLVTFSICILSGYGVYLGRFIRLNSWDILKPKFLIKQIIDSLTWFGFFFTIGMGLVIYVLYWLFYIFKTEEILD